LSLAKAVAEGVVKGHAQGGPRLKVGIESKRVGDAAGIHVLTATGAADKLVLTHESRSRRGFAEGAVRAAEWLATRTGCFDFQDVYTEI
jgi:4-hydroxy-tetrahydrodipicolinate reductase